MQFIIGPSGGPEWGSMDRADRALGEPYTGQSISAVGTSFAIVPFSHPLHAHRLASVRVALLLSAVGRPLAECAGGVIDSLLVSWKGLVLWVNPPFRGFRRYIHYLISQVDVVALVLLPTECTTTVSEMGLRHLHDVDGMCVGFWCRHAESIQMREGPLDFSVSLFMYP